MMSTSSPKNETYRHPTLLNVTLLNVLDMHSLTYQDLDHIDPYLPL